MTDVTDRPAVIQTGDLLPACPYLWNHQRDRGEDAGRKRRPVCVAVAVSATDGLTHLALLPLSGTPPHPEQTAIELPALDIRRLGLSEFKQAWVTVSEFNYDVLERSFSLEPPRAPLRRLSPGFLKVVLRAFRPFLAQAAARIDRV